MHGFCLGLKKMEEHSHPTPKVMPNQLKREIELWFPDASIKEIYEPFPFFPNGRVIFIWSGIECIYNGDRKFDFVTKDNQTWFQAHSLLCERMSQLGITS